MERLQLSVDGMRIRTIAAGPPEAPPLVLLHGYPTSSALWRGCIPALSRRRRVFAPDLPGHGDSDKPIDAEYDLPFLVRFVEGVADGLGLRRFALAAHDLGGMAGLGFAARRRERLTHLVVLDTAPYADWPLACRALVAAARTPVLARLLLAPFPFRLMLRMGVHRPEAIPPEVAEGYRAHWLGSPEARRAFSAAVAMPPGRMALPLEELRSIDVPTLILWADHDLMFGKRVARRLARDLPAARLTVLPRCGHFLQEDDPAAVAGAIDEFLGGMPPRPE